MPQQRAHLNAASLLPVPAGGRTSQPQRFYVEQLATMKERELKCLYVNFEHIAEYDQVRRRAAAAGQRQPCSSLPTTLFPTLPRSALSPAAG